MVLEDGRRLGDCMDDGQRADLDALDDPKYRHAYLERPRGHSKTGDVGTEAVVELLTGCAKQLFCLAADEDQARILLGDVKGKLLRGGHVESGAVEIFKNRIESTTGSVLKVMPADVASSWGLRPDWVACDEICEWRYPALWQSRWTATGKRPRSRVMVISTAGWDQTHFAWDVRTKIAQREADWYFSSRGQCASWIDPAWLQQQERTLPEHVFKLLHLNLWVDGVGASLTAAEVDAIFSGDVPGGAGRHCLGLDVGLTKDSSVSALVRRTPESVYVVDVLETWTGSPGAKVDLTQLEESVYLAARKYAAPVWLDPFQAVQMAQQLTRRGVSVREHAITSTSRPLLFNQLLKTVRDGKLRSRPHDALRRELLGLEVRETLTGFRVDHKPGRNDDHVFAVALAGCVERGGGFTVPHSASRRTRRSRIHASARLDPGLTFDILPCQSAGCRWILDGPSFTSGSRSP